MTRRITTGLCLLALATAACGGGDDDTTATKTPNESAPGVDDDGTDTGTEDVTDGQGAPDTSGASSTTAVVPSTTEPVPQPVAPTGRLVVPLVGVEPAPAPASAEAMFAAMFRDLVDAADRFEHYPAAAAAALVDDDVASAAPDVAIEAATASLAISTQLGDIVVAHLEAGLGAGVAAEIPGFIEPRLPWAEFLREPGAVVHSILTDVVDAPLLERQCVALAVFDDTDECSDRALESPLVIDALATIDELLDTDYDGEQPDDPGYELRDAVDLCAIWNQTFVDDVQRDRFDFLVDDTFLDTDFLERSECRWQADLGEDAPTPVADAATVAPVLQAVAAAALAGGFDEEFYDTAGVADDNSWDIGTADATFAFADSISTSVSQVVNSTNDPRLWLGYRSAAAIAQNEAVYFRYLEASSWDHDAAFDAAVGCTLGFSDADGCEPYLPGWDLGQPAVDWDDMSDDVDICGAWNPVITSYATDEIADIEFAIDHFDIDDLLGFGECERISDDSGATG